MKNLPEQWQFLRLSEVCELNPRQQTSHDGDVTFVPMAAIDEHMGEIARPEVRAISDVRRGFTPFVEDDVLFAKITPCMQNGKAAIARNLVNRLGFGSTEFHVLRARPVVLPEWLFLLVRRPEFRRAAEAAFTGTAGQQRVPTDFLSHAKIPVPPLSEQHRIVEILNEARDIYCLRTQAEDLTTKLIPALFYDMFSDLMPKESECERPRLNTIADVQGGLQVSQRRDSMPLKRPYLRVANVHRGRLDLSEVKEIGLSERELERTRLLLGDVLLVEGHGNIDELGRAALWNNEVLDCVHQNHIIRVRCGDSIEPTYLCSFINSVVGRRYLSVSGNTTSGLNTISTGVVGNLPVPIPPLDQQVRFAQIVKAVRELEKEREDNRITSKLGSSLLAYAFSGELTAAWRKANFHQIAKEAKERDHWLLENGIKLTVPDARIRYSLKETGKRPEELNQEQCKLLVQIQNLDPIDNGGTFTLSSLVSALEEPLDTLPPDTIRRHLDVLAARGLVKAISRRVSTGSSSDVTFGTVFRLPRGGRNNPDSSEEDDFAKASELKRFSEIWKGKSVPDPEPANIERSE